MGDCHSQVFRPVDLPPLEGKLEMLCEAMRREKAPLVVARPPVCEFAIPTTVESERRELVFPEPLRNIEELLILCHSSGVEESPSGEHSDLALLVAHPADGAYELFPQDWFNSAGLDYLYQWVTRVARDPRTRRIHGEGIRIRSFVLDDTLRNTL